MECPGCEKTGPYVKSNGYILLAGGRDMAKYRCLDCEEEFWWP